MEEEKLENQVSETNEEVTSEEKQKPELKKRFKHRWVGIVLNCVIGFFGTIIVTIGSFLIYASATTLHVKDVETVKVKDAFPEMYKELHLNEENKIMTWNIGYCALDETADFFMDGGKEVRAHSIDQVKNNIHQIGDQISAISPDIAIIQEIDIDSSRSYRYDELNFMNARLSQFNKAFAANYKAGYVPYPFPKTLGKVYSGVATYSKFAVSDAKRYQLPIPFKWPVSLLNLKRCLLVERIPIAGSEKELVVINLHLEAYSEAAGKAKQLAKMFSIVDAEIAAGNYVIVGGDFNQTFSNIDQYPYTPGNWETPVIDVNTEGYDKYQFIMDNTHPTCRLLDKPYKDADHDPNKFQYYMIDGFICSKNVDVISTETLNLEFKNSDHNPVLMNFKLAA